MGKEIVYERNLILNSKDYFNNTSQIVKSYDLGIDIETGTEVTLFFKGTATVPTQKFYFFSDNGMTLLTTYTRPSGEEVSVIKFNWKKSIYKDKNLSLYNLDGDGTQYMGISEAKLVVGNTTLIEWTPSPEEMLV